MNHSAQAVEVIRIVSKRGKVSSRTVARLTGVLRTTASHHLRRLCARGLLERHGLGRGTRPYLYTATDDGREYAGLERRGDK